MPDADRITLIRRLSFDLRGLPPSLAEVDEFLRDNDARAWERLVDRFLTSDAFGERMAVWWLDLVRFADSAGYHSDNEINVAPYREWVIDSFNANRPFDQFTVEQLAGDLLPSPTRSQRVATAYNRLLQTTEEGGAQAEEYIAKYSSDRVRNYGQVWLGGTIMCAECHNHKFDPYTQADFYSVAAFFADIQEPSIGNLAESLLLRHHSVVGLIDRAETCGLVIRRRDDLDGRIVRVALTVSGSERLARLTAIHLTEIARLAAILAKFDVPATSGA